MKRILVTAIGILMMTFSTAGYALTSCTTAINNIFAGDDGNIWLFFSSGLVVYIVPSDPDTKNMFTLATTALVADKQLTIRILADGVPCTSGVRSDVVGMYLNK